MMNFIHTFLLHKLSVGVGKLTHIRQPIIKIFLIRCFILFYKVDLSELQRQDIHQYQHFNDFFTRELSQGARSTLIQKNKIVSPVDGIISELGNIKVGKLIQAKKIYYDVNSLLGGDEQDALPFQQGQFINFYLAPHNYHRVHMPMDAQLEKMLYIPGQLFPLAPWSVKLVPQLFCRNERVVCLFKTELGPMAMVLVGALFVDSIATSWHGIVNTSHSSQKNIWDYTKDDINLQQHQYMGQFQYGSTVILLFPQKTMQLQISLQQLQSIKVGDEIAEFSSQM